VLLGTRLAYASALARSGDHGSARQHYEKLSADLHGNYVETLHDYATFFLDEVDGGRSADADADLQRAIDMLEEARRLITRGEHGYWQVTLNWAEALARAGRAQDAERYVRDLLEDAMRHNPDRYIESQARMTLRKLVDLTSAADGQRLKDELWDLDEAQMAQQRRDRVRDEPAPGHEGS